jgi:hypothetical protein
MEWTNQTFNSTYTYIKIIYANGMFVTINNNEKIFISQDGFTLELRKSVEAPNTLSKIVYGNNLFVAVGAKTIITSSNGIT